MATTQGPIGEVFLSVAVTPTTVQGPAVEVLSQSSVTLVTTRGSVDEVEVDSFAARPPLLRPRGYERNRRFNLPGPISTNGM